MSTSFPSAGASPFAHLARLGKKASDDEKNEEESKRAEEDKKKEEEAKRAEEEKKKEEEDAKKAEEDKKKKDEEAKKKGKADDGDDDSDRDDDENPEARAARARERGRIRAIVTSEPGKLNPVGAMHIATGTSMSRRQAVEMLHAMPAPAAAEPARAADPLRDRMAGVQPPNVGTGGAPPAEGPKALAEAIIAAGKKRRGES